MARKEVGQDTKEDKKQSKTATQSKKTKKSTGKGTGTGKARISTAEQYERDTKAVQMSIAGTPLDVIARELGWADASGAAKAITRRLKERAYESVDTLRDVEIARLDRMLMTLEPYLAYGPALETIELPSGEKVYGVVPPKAQMDAMDRVMKIMEQRRRLVPQLEVPKPVQEITGAGGAPFFVELMHPLPDVTQQPVREEDLEK